MTLLCESFLFVMVCVWVFLLDFFESNFFLNLMTVYL